MDSRGPRRNRGKYLPVRKVILRGKVSNAYTKRIGQSDVTKDITKTLHDQIPSFQIIGNHYTVNLVLFYARRLFDNAKLNCAEKHTNAQLFYVRIYDAVAKTSS